MCPTNPSPLDPPAADAQLIAAAQRYGGAHCHEASNLIACYTFSTELHRRAVCDGDLAGARAARNMVAESETNLRKFVFQCRLPERMRDPRYGGEAPELPETPRRAARRTRSN
jgi:hypothetical protein